MTSTHLWGECPVGTADADETQAITFALFDFLELNKDTPVALIDIDGVVLNNNHRLHHIVETGADGKQRPRSDPDWKAFHAAAHLDTPGVFAPIVRDLIIGQYYPIFLTARVEIWDTTRSNLVQMLSAAIQYPIDPRFIILRDRDSSWPADKFKAHIVSQMIMRGIKIGVALDDSHANCQAYRLMGIPVLRAYNHLREDALEY